MHRMIQVGTGGMGRTWCERFLPDLVADGLVEVVAAVDVVPAMLENARTGLGLPPERLYTDIHEAFRDHGPEADFCTVVVPPAFHESIVDVAIAHGLHILSEKPIADTLLASCRIARKVERAGLKMGVTMSHRFDQDKTTLRHAIRDAETGPVDYLMGRFTDDCRAYGRWGAFRHDITDPMLIEGSVHHLDILADLAGAECEMIYAETWNPEWGEFGGDSQVLVTMRFANGRRAVYEGALANAVRLNGWGQEYVRAECRNATLIMDHRRVERFPEVTGGSREDRREGRGEEVPLLQQERWGHAWLIEQFVRWLDGGPAMETAVQRNLQSVANIFAAIESGRTGQPVHVQDLLAETQRHLDDA